MTTSEESLHQAVLADLAAWSYEDDDYDDDLDDDARCPGHVDDDQALLYGAYYCDGSCVVPSGLV
jgi:hypothetical protein